MVAFGQGLLEALDDVLHGELVGHDLEQRAHDDHVVSLAVAHLQGGAHGVDGVDGDVLAAAGVVDAVGVEDKYSAGLYLGSELVEALLVEGDDHVVAVEHGR